MDDNELDLSWATEQLANARVPVPVGRGVIKLLTSWADIDFPNEVQRDQALEIFSKLARDQALVEPTEEVWKPVMVGFALQVGNTVRVRSDAFSGPAGRVHNGRVGRVVAKRSGDIIVKTTDGKSPTLDGAHYPPSALEVKIQG